MGDCYITRRGGSAGGRGLPELMLIEHGGTTGRRAAFAALVNYFSKRWSNRRIGV